MSRLGELLAARAAWERAHSEMRCLTHTWPWVLAQWAAAYPIRRLVVLTGFSGRELTFTIPLLLPNRGRATVVEVATELEPFWFRDPVADALEHLTEYLDAEAPSWRAVAFPMVACDAATVASLGAAAHEAGMSTKLVTTHQSPWLSLDEVDDRYWASRTGRVKVANRREKELERLGALSIRQLTRVGEMEDAVLRLLEIEQESWKYDRSSDMTSRGNQHILYATLARTLAERGWLVVNILEFNDEPIAYEYDGLYRDGVYSLKHSYKERFYRSSPGIILRSASLRRYASQGLRYVDFWGSADDFKRLWTRETRAHGTLTLYRRSLAAKRTRLRNRVGEHLAGAPGISAIRTALLGAPDRHKKKDPTPGAIERTCRRFERPRRPVVVVATRTEAEPAPPGVEIGRLSGYPDRIHAAQLGSGVRQIARWLEADPAAPTFAAWRSGVLVALIAATDDGALVHVRATFASLTGREAVPALVAAFAQAVAGRRVQQCRPGPGAVSEIDVVEAFGA